VLAAALAVLFVILTAAVVAGLTNRTDLVLTRDLQSLPWGPLQPAFALADQWDGLRQVILGLLVVLAVFALDRRLGVLALFCPVSDALWYLLELVIARPRPDGHLVHVVRHAAGGTYPSGHAVYYFWALLMLALAITPRLPRLLRPLPWLLAAMTLALVCVGRIEYGEHWPSDVLGGLLLGGAWTLAVLAIGGSFSPSGRWRTSAAPGIRSQGRPAPR
jgi:undecaprenyl-diphosphatase